ncbi:hypothetical protein VTN49DRAFT_5711 [Thermomyces lanuginosus]|uniref:uncharacterized protein n=1 Tax=Thermomyces lanuginosus TaxID=5541 RepID=UPI0037420CAB
MLPRAQDPAESSTTGMSARSGDLHNGARNVAENEIHKVASPTIAWSTSSRLITKAFVFAIFSPESGQANENTALPGGLSLLSLTVGSSPVCWVVCTLHRYTKSYTPSRHQTRREKRTNRPCKPAICRCAIFI